jgi:hypothetical protein
VQLAALLLIALGIAVVSVTIGKPNEWSPPIARFILWRGANPQPPPRERIRGLGYLVAVFGLLQFVLATWFPGR